LDFSSKNNESDVESICFCFENNSKIEEILKDNYHHYQRGMWWGLLIRSAQKLQYAIVRKSKHTPSAKVCGAEGCKSASRRTHSSRIAFEIGVDGEVSGDEEVVRGDDDDEDDEDCG
jgi:hypothetical protein